MTENALTKVSRIAVSAAQGALVKDKDGNDKVIKPTGDGNNLDFRDVTIGGGGNTDSGGGDNPDNPDSANYYAGDLYSGEIKDRKLEWSGADDPSSDLSITFNDDPGDHPFGQYSGITILGHIQKTAMNSGTKGTTSNLKLNYDSSNVSKEGYFTTTGSYPIYIRQSDLVVGKRLSIPINGVGEDLGGTNVKSPSIYLTYNSNRSLTISHDSGYNNDGNSAGSTGANYDFVVELIATFSTQTAVAQLPASVNLFSGSSSGNIALSGSSNSFANCNHGLVIKFTNWIQTATDTNNSPEYSKPSDFGIKDIILDKEHLISGLKLSDVEAGLKTGSMDAYYKFGNNYNLDPSIKARVNNIKTNEVLIGEDTLNVQVGMSITSPSAHSTSTKDIYFKVSKICTLEE